MKWIATHDPITNGFVIDDEEGEMIADIPSVGKTLQENRDIANLIAAAPQMLLVLKQFVSYFDSNLSEGEVHLKNKAKDLIRNITK